MANSAVTRERIREAYGLESTVIHPPVEPVSTDAPPPPRGPDRPFAAVVARERGYKNVPLSVESARAAGVEIVVVGAGSESLHDPAGGSSRPRGPA